jgi:hypothetical protein
MKQIKQIFSWWLTAMFLMVFLTGNALASEMAIEPIVLVAPSSEPVKIGTRYLIPLTIYHSPRWKSAQIKFVTGTDPVQIEDISLDANQYGQKTVYLPVTVNSKGEFKYIGNITIEAPDGEKFANGLSTWSTEIIGLYIFAFDGDVFFSGASGGALRNAVSRNLYKNSEYTKLLDKQQKVKSGASRGQTFSKDEESRLYEIRRNATNALLKELYADDAIQSKRELRELRQPLRRNDVVTLTVGWATSSAYNSFLPVDGAQISIIDNNSSTIFSSGVLSGGKYSFVVTKDNLSFTAKVTAKYGNGFEIINGNNSQTIEIGFSDFIFSTLYDVRSLKSETYLSQGGKRKTYLTI